MNASSASITEYSQRPTSRKTRIKTMLKKEVWNNKDKLRDQLPEKQGLRLVGPYSSIPGLYCQLRDQLPRKQGLRLGYL